MTTEEKIKAIVEKKFDRWMDEDFDVHRMARYYYAMALEELSKSGSLDALYVLECETSELERAKFRAGC